MRRTHQAGVTHYECGDTSLARSVLEQAVDLSTAGPARGRVLLDLGMGLAEAEGWRGGMGHLRGRSGRGGRRSRAGGAGRAEPRVHLAVPGRPGGVRTARARGAGAGRGVAGPTGDGRSVPGVSVRRVPPRTRRRSGAARSRARPRGAHGGRVQVRRPCASFTTAQLLKSTDRLDEARRMFAALLGDAAAHGVESPIAQFRYHLAELECRAGTGMQPWSMPGRAGPPPSDSAWAPCPRRVTSRWGWWKPISGARTRRGWRPSKGWRSPRRRARPSS